LRNSTVAAAAERGTLAAELAAVVRQNRETVRRWLVRYQAERIAGFANVVRMGAPPEAPPAYLERLLGSV